MTDYHLSLANSTDGEVSLWLEPWGDLYLIPVGVTCQIVFRAASDGIPQLEVRDDRHVIAWGWPGCTAGVFVEGNELHGRNLDEGSPVPDVPHGLTVKQFIDLVEHGDQEGSR